MKNKKTNWWKVAGIILIIVNVCFLVNGLSKAKQERDYNNYILQHENDTMLHAGNFTIGRQALNELLVAFKGGDYVFLTNLETNKSVVVQKAINNTGGEK